jgi:transcriptional antiterminator RfaH
VEALMQMTRSDGRVSFSSAMAAGDKVRFLTGPFADLVGSLEHLDEGGRVRVLLNILGRETAVKADASQLLPLK